MVVVDDITHILKLKGFEEMTKKTEERQSKCLFVRDSINICGKLVINFI